MFTIIKNKRNTPIVRWLLKARVPCAGMCRFNLRLVGVFGSWLYATDGHRAHRISLPEALSPIPEAEDGAYRVYETDDRWLFVNETSQNGIPFPEKINLQFEMTDQKPIHPELFMADTSHALAQIVRHLPGNEHIDIHYLQDALGDKTPKEILLSEEKTCVPILIRSKAQEAVVMPKGV